VSKQTRLLDLSFPIIRHNERGESKHLRIGKIAADLPNIETKIASVLSAQNLGEDLPRKSDILDSVPGFEKPQALQIGLDSEASSLVHEAIRQVDRERDLQDEANGPAESVAQAATLLRNVRLSGSMTKVKQIRGQLKAIRNVCDELLEQVERIENSALDLDK
jgi:hypothetical protein